MDPPDNFWMWQFGAYVFVLFLVGFIMAIARHKILAYLENKWNNLFGKTQDREDKKDIKRRVKTGMRRP